METGVVKKADWYDHGHAPHMATRLGCHNSSKFQGFLSFLHFIQTIFLFLLCFCPYLYDMYEDLRCLIYDLR